MGYSRVKLSQMLTDLTSHVGDNSIFWVHQEKVDAINEGLKIWQALTGEWTTSFEIPVTSGHYYNVPRQVASVSRMLYNTTVLEDTSLWELDYGTPGWEGTDGTPAEWAPHGVNEVVVYPAPTSGVLTFEGISEPIAVHLDGDFVDIGDEELTKILHYAHHYLTFKEGPSEAAATEGDLKGLMAAAALKNGRLLASEFYKDYMGIAKDEGQRPLSMGPGAIGGRA